MLIRYKKINLIINNLIINHKLPDFLIRSKIKCMDGHLVFKNFSTDSLETLPEIMVNKISRKNLNNLVKKFLSLGELLVFSNESDKEVLIPELLESLWENSGFPHDISYVKGEFHQNHIVSKVIDPDKLDSSVCPDFLFDFGSFDLASLIDVYKELKDILIITCNIRKVIELTFFLNYLFLKGKIPNHKSIMQLIIYIIAL